MSLSAAALFDMLQVQEPSRHWRVLDAMVKMAGRYRIEHGLTVCAICDAPLTLPQRLFDTEGSKA
ncbi:MAG: hypothetical protein ACTHNN_16955 [Xanthobacteraceae bacterium]